MPSETVLTVALARIARIPFRLFVRRPPLPPQKALILKPCCVSQVMLTTPLLTALSRMYPDARFDWAISEWVRPAVIGNPRIAQVVSTGSGTLEGASWKDVRDLVRRIRAQEYDTCFIPSRSSLLALIPWWAGIPQRVGLDVSGRGFAHTLPVKPRPGLTHAADIYLSLAEALKADQYTEALSDIGMSFFPSDSDRKAVAQRLADELDWHGAQPLVVVHPGGARNPARSVSDLRWPAERFALLSNRLLREHDARILLIGDERDQKRAKEISGMASVPVAVWSGRLSLGELGALSEVASLYVGNDAGPTHIAAAVGCPTLAIFGPTDPDVCGPYAPKGNVRSLRRQSEGSRPFYWEHGVTVAEAVEAANELLAERP